ncbi:DUF2786 domain-containing protein [Streptomyces sp. NPDC088400]|uniref:DUF2786 domain-containing protein n=1 Tax=Streptomyces sp. NPDC088400 TaxID=3365861 RepID=UPI00381D1B10
MADHSTGHVTGADHGAGRGTATEFATARRIWLRTRVTELSDVLADHSPRLHALIPSGLGDQRLVNALVTLRIAADEARVRPMGETVAWLELLIPQGHRHDLHGAVREVRVASVLAGDPALWSWNAEAWEELLLALWRRDRALMADGSYADDELVSRWGVRTPRPADIQHPEKAPEANGYALAPLTDVLASEAEPVRLLVQAVLAQPHAVDSIADSLIVYEEAFQGAGHLAFLAGQRLGARYVHEWCEKQASEATEAGAAFLEELSDAVDTYLDHVVQPVINSLSVPERVLLTTGELPSRRGADEYLTEFLDCVPVPPVNAGPEGVPDDEVAREAEARMARGELTWHGMRGSVPVWYHVVTSPQERAAALALSGRASSPAIHVHTDLEVPRQFDLFDGLFLADGPDRPDGSDGSVTEAAPDEWYPEPGIEIRYSRHSATDLCELSALARLGHARLEFLVPEADGGIGLLRSLRAAVRPGDASDWAREALTVLRTLVSHPDDLADAVARESVGEGDPEDFDEDDELNDLGGPSGSVGPSGGAGAHGGQKEPTGTTRPNGPDDPETPSPSPSTSGSLPAALLARVKAVLRQAEDPGATKAEAEAFLKKATEMMAKHGIERAMLSGDEPTSEQPADRVVEVTAPWMREGKRLLAWIAGAMRCHSIYPGGKANRHRVHLFGFASDLHAVEVLYVSLRLQMLQGAEQASTQHRPVREEARAYKRSWMLGFIRAVTTRIGEAERAARDEAEHDRHQASSEAPEGRSVALVLADRTAAVQEKVAARYPKLSKSRPSQFKGSGYRQGHEDGQRANIGGVSLEDQEETELTA